MFQRNRCLSCDPAASDIDTMRHDAVTPGTAQRAAEHTSTASDARDCMPFASLAMVLPSGLNFSEKTSPAWPESSIIGACRSEVLRISCNATGPTSSVRTLQAGFELANHPRRPSKLVQKVQIVPRRTFAGANAHIGGHSELSIGALPFDERARAVRIRRHCPFIAGDQRP